MTVKLVGSSMIKPLIDALSTIYWYKNDLEDFFRDTLPQDYPSLSLLDPGRQSKREMASVIVKSLFKEQSRYFDALLQLILAIDDIKDPGWLKKLPDGAELYAAAMESLKTFHAHVAPYKKMKSEAEQVKDRHDRERARNERRQVHVQGISDLRELFHSISKFDPQKRGYELEKLLTMTFRFFEIDARGSFRVLGEQIDGAFTLEGTEFLLEAKWQEKPIGLADIYEFTGKVDGKLDNTLGLFVSMGGFQPTAIEKLNGKGRSRVILMDGVDLAAIYGDNIGLPTLLARKKQHAAQTGEVKLDAWSII